MTFCTRECPPDCLSEKLEMARRIEEMESMYEEIAYMLPSDLEAFRRTETTATAFSVAVSSPEERSVPLYVRKEA